MPACHRLVATRRTALGGALVGSLVGWGVLSGCELTREDGDSPGAGAPPVEDLDSALVDEVLTRLTELTDLVSVTGARYPRLRKPMGALRELHVVHRAALGDDPGPRATDGGLLPGPAEALELVRTRERRAQAQLADWSVAAESGALARLLASMSAGVAQQLVLLPSALGMDR